MRTITENFAKRLVLQAEEAETQGMVKLAEQLTAIIEKNPIRHVDDSYIYDLNSFADDVQSSLWDIIVRASDFYGTTLDSIEAQKIVDHYSEEFVADLRKIAGIKKNVGKYELEILGEVKED